MNSTTIEVCRSISGVKRTFPGVKLISLISLALFCCGAAQATISYSISFDHPENHLFHVTVAIPDVHGHVTVQMPAWNATYQIRDFASRIQNLRATEKSGAKLQSDKIDKQTWNISGNGAIQVAYDILWDEPGPFGSQLNSVHAFMNLAEILVYVPERSKEGVELYLESGEGKPLPWKLATALDFSFMMMRGTTRVNRANAINYDALVDAPIEYSEAELMRPLSFQLEGINPPVWVAVHGENYNKRELEEGLTKIVRYETQLMGGAPYDHYQFIFHIDSSGAGGGGMEHANSTAIGATSTSSAISTAAHEFFHLWNVKRIRPQSLEPIDYTKEMYTRSLWFAEGVTSTYAAYAEVRTGLWTPNQFYEDLAYQIQELQGRPARKWQSVEESSLNAWLEKYPQYNQPDYSISYYNKGQLDAFLLDVLIREATDNHKSLDDVMRSMNEKFAKKGLFYNDSADIEATAESVAGVSFKDFFAKYVAGTDELPYTDILAKAGLNLVTSETSHATFGFETNSVTGGGPTYVSSVAPRSGAEKAGLRAGDLVLNFDGKPVNMAALVMWPREHRPGDTVKLRVRRKNVEIDLSFAAASTAVGKFQVAPMKDPTEKQRRIREGLLQGKTN
jgi:predicted metalloprotease with PDZ domain